MCEKCGGSCYENGSWNGGVYSYFEKTGRLKCYDCLD